MEDVERKLYEAELDAQHEELRSSQQLLEETVNLYSELYDNSPTASISFSETGRVTALNARAAELLGIDRNHVINLPFIKWLTQESMSVFHENLLHAKRCGKNVSHKIIIRRTPSTILMIITRPITDGTFQSTLIELETKFTSFDNGAVA